MPHLTFAVLGSLQLLAGVSAQTWCNKHYMASQPVVPPGGNFPVAAASKDPLLAFRCAAAMKPYLAEDIGTPAGVLIDSPVVYSEISGAQPIDLLSGPLSSAGELDVTVSLNGKTLVNALVPLNASAYELSFSLDGITPQMTPYNLSCEATYAASSSSPQTYSASAALSVLPNPTNSSVTKMDLRTGALLAKPATGLGGEYEPIFPIGFYTTFDGYLSTNLSAVDTLKEQGFTIIHIVPTFDNMTAFEMVLDRMQEVGLYLMYDMRFTYMNNTSVMEQVNSIKYRPNLLLWYTGDEPDGTSDPLNATSIAYDLIYSLDGYHPVSLVLNCQDYEWASYTAGTDIVMQDVYMIGNNVTWSNEWNTTCTPDYGDCGCDNCFSIAAGDSAAVPPNSTYYGSTVPANSGVGSYFDISDRVASFKNRLEVMGWERTKAVWTVPQAFGSAESVVLVTFLYLLLLTSFVRYWMRTPTGEEWVVQSIMGINHGALGVVPWVDPNPDYIKMAASGFALSLPKLTPFFFNAASVRSNYLVGGVDIATWAADTETLVLATNTDYVTSKVTWKDIGLHGGGVEAVYTSGSVENTGSSFTLGSVASAAFVVRS
ncbi:uncharacterized protein EDB91DRAFT_1303264 [Suillus paluster]|uniref:uncharacterized protein n=1 Tax=Suillus paluster TaxID=48578 RepID=UPI001B864822|nr:uncharacterized protein EDB91DRAFT_1303264 [Suillus paluster]KAG1750354.1 hypothetical protein EDB91DRAFT_1303264 [Suillus paluster]